MIKGSKMSLEARRKISEHNKQTGKIPPSRKGIKLTEEHKRKISESEKGKKVSIETLSRMRKSFRKGENSPHWKGENVKYQGLHVWVRKQLGNPTKCEYCGIDGLTGLNIHWANKSGNYKRELSDWIRLCRKCHAKYDEIPQKAWITRLRNYKPQKFLDFLKTI